MGVIRNAWYSGTGRKGYGKHLDTREKTAADVFYRGALLKLEHQSEIENLATATYQAEHIDIDKAYKRFRKGEMNYSAFKKAVNDVLKRRKTGKETTIESILEKAAAAVLFLAVVSSIFLPGSITGASVYDAVDSNMGNMLFVIGAVLACLISYFLLRKN